MTDMLESTENNTAQFYVRDRDNMTASSNHLQSHGWWKVEVLEKAMSRQQKIHG